MERPAAPARTLGAGRDDQGQARQRRPDFFIVGHQKSGTTAVWEMLRRHPQVFMPRVKEPRYFALDMRSRLGEPTVAHRRSLQAYLALFAAAGPDQIAGEASPQYLRSRVAAQEIAKLVPQARIVAIFREPASFVRSFHLQLVHNHAETQRDLRHALELEPQRRQGRRIPRRCHHAQDLLYSEHVRYAEQLRRFHEAFGREQVLALIYDDLRADNDGVMRELLRFLGIDDTVAIQAAEIEPVKAVRSARLHRLRGVLWRASHNPAAAGRLSRAAVALMPKRARRGAPAALLRRAAYTSQRPSDEALMAQLRERFRPHVMAFSDYLGRDLTALWGYDRIV